MAAYRQGRGRAPTPSNGIDGKTQQRSSSSAYSESEDMNGLVLHEEVGEGGFMNGINGYSKASFRGLELESMPEEDHNMELRGDIDDRPSTSGMETLTPPSIGSGSIDGEDDRSEAGAELNRGRDRTVRNQNGANDQGIKVKSEMEAMET